MVIFSVLVVEDHPDIREVLRAAIAHAGFSVFEASSGAEALERLSELPNLHAVIADFHPPEGHGLVPALKRARPKLPVVVLSGDPHRAHKALLQADLVLGNRIPTRVLIAELQRLLMGPATTERSVPNMLLANKIA